MNFWLSPSDGVRALVPVKHPLSTDVDDSTLRWPSTHLQSPTP